MTPTRLPSPRHSRTIIGTTCAILIAASIAGWLVTTWTDWLWYREVHFTQVLRTTLTARATLFVLCGAAATLIIGGNLLLAYRLRPLAPPLGEPPLLGRFRYLLTPHIRGLTSAFALLIGLITGGSAQTHWAQWLLFQHAQNFHRTDPQFGVDAAFYVFRYPFWRFLLTYSLTTLTITLITTATIHYLYGGIRFHGHGDRCTPSARTHLTTLIALLVLGKAVAYFLDRRGILLSQIPIPGTPLTGAGFTDIKALLPAKETLAWVSILVAIAILVFSRAFARSILWPGLALALALLSISAVTIGGVYPAAVQLFDAKPNSRDKEAQYIGRNISATRFAYGIDTVDYQPYPAVTTPPGPDIVSDPTVHNARILDPTVVADTYTALQQVRSFYDFTQKLDVDRYTMDGVTSDYVVGVRELDTARLQGNQTNWQNKHAVFTHGYGLVAAPADRVTCGGEPYVVSGFLNQPAPSATSMPSPGSDTAQEATATQLPAAGSPSSGQCAAPADQIPLTQPRVYYGELTNAYSIVGHSGHSPGIEFDRPTSSAEPDTFTYDGKGGISIGSWSRRLLFALRFKEPNFLLSDVVNRDSKLLFIRNPRARVQRVAPFLTLDNDPYPAAINGRLVWIIDGYTTASSYPYSQRIDVSSTLNDTRSLMAALSRHREGINYIRNSVKATVDAYDGTIHLYAFDDTDPVLRAWNAAYGGALIEPLNAAPFELQQHFRYPEDLFKIQRSLLGKYHVTDPKQFFSGDAFWQTPGAPETSGTSGIQDPYYVMAQFPQQSSPTFQLTSVMTPMNRQNLAAIVTGYYSNHRPRLDVLEVPDHMSIFGPAQAHNQMASHPDTRKDISLFQTTESQVKYGNLLTLPVHNGVLYVEPLYIQARGSTYPLLKKVLVEYGQYVGYADTVTEALSRIVTHTSGAPASPNPAPPTTATPPPDVSAAVSAMDNAITALQHAQQTGDFSGYGRALQQLSDAIKRYETLNPTS